MAIQTAKNFIEEKGLIRRTDLAELKGTRLAIDVHHWLKQFRFDEPYHMAMSGIPLTLGPVIDAELEKLRQNDIIPLFVFNGINLPPAPTLNQDGQQPLSYAAVRTVGLTQHRQREEAWRLYQNREYDNAKEQFLAAGTSVNSSDFLEALLKHFRLRGVEFFRAPYLAWAQCAWFCGQKDRVASAVWGSEEILLFNGLCQNDKLILRVDFHRGIYEWISLTDVCHALRGVSVSQLIDCCILVGFRGNQSPYERDRDKVEIDYGLLDGIATGLQGLPQTNSTHLFAQSFWNIQEVAADVMQCQSGPSLLEFRVRNYGLETQYLDQVLELFLRVKNLIMHHIILNMDCTTVPISMHNNTHPDTERNYYSNSVMTMPQRNVINNMVPNNLHTIIGPRLPNLVYYFLSIGLVSPQVINNVVHNTMIEYLPIIESLEYREFLQKIVPLRTQIAYLLINSMIKGEIFWKVQPHGGRRPVMSYAQWQTDKAVILHTPPELVLDDWDVSKKLIEKTLPTDERGQVVMNFCSVLPFANRAQKASVPNMSPNVFGGPKTIYSHFEEVMCVVLLKSLDLLGYFTHPPQQKPHGTDESGTSLFAEALQEIGYPYAEQGVLIIELIRTRALNCEPFKPPTPTHYSQNPNDMVTITSYHDPNVLLISRVLSIVPMQLRAEDWQSNIVVRDLCAFHVLFKSLYKTLRNLCEIIMLVMFLDNRVKVGKMLPDSVSFFQELVNHFPFRHNINSAMGIVIYYILVLGDGAVGNTPMEKWNSLGMESLFPCCKDIREDLSHAFGLWIECIKVINKLQKGQAITHSLYQAFMDANGRLHDTMQQFGIQPPKPKGATVGQTMSNHPYA